MESRFKDRGLGAIEADERGGAEAGAAGGVGCFDIGNFCEGAGCRLAGHLIRSDERQRGKLITRISKESCGRTIPHRQYGDSELVEAARYAARWAASSPQLAMGAATVWPTPFSLFSR